MTSHEAVQIARVARTVPHSLVELETAKRVLEDLLANIEQPLSAASSERVRETG